MIDSAERAAELYLGGVSRRILVSGFANPYHDARETEATILARELVRRGVPESAIILDHQAANTGENIINAARILRESNIPTNDVILVQKPYMTRRFLATAEAQWPAPQPRFYVTSQPTTLRQYYQLNQTVYGDGQRMVTLMLGDYERLKTYPAKGFLTQQPTSSTAESAWQALIERGFLAKEQ